MPKRRYCFPLLLSVACAFVLAQTRVSAEGALSFNRDVRSILTDKCFACHGLDSETVEGGLRLDDREQAVDESGAIVPGDADASEVIRRILSDDPDEVMPPAELHKPLTDEEKNVIRQWVTEGAIYEPHWAYAPMRRSAPLSPAPAANSASQRIDAAIDHRLQQEGVSPVGTADRITLIRRLSQDLTGLPPTVEEVEAFLSDQSQHAYANLVNRLLISPRYGERMAVYWLDLVRYADTVGYHGDQNVSHSPYRDYVIDSFNQNLPYDQFIREQLAGDLLPGSTLTQKIASGYNRLNQTTQEGGAQAKEYLSIYFADRVRNVSQVFMGATVGCAQCHDHKYDPYTTKDFYSLGAFFADIEERGVYGGNRPPEIRVPSGQLNEQIATMDRQLEDQKSQVQPLRQRLSLKQANWEAELRSQLSEVVETEDVWFDDTFRNGSRAREKWDLVSRDDGPVFSGERSRRQQDSGLVQHIFDDPQKTFTVEQGTEFFAWVHMDADKPPSAIMLQLFDGDWNHRKVWGSDTISYGRKPQSDGAYRRAGELPELGRWVRLVASASEIGLKPGSEISAMAFTQFGGLTHWDRTGVIRRNGVSDLVRAGLESERIERTEEQSSAIEELFFSEIPELIELKEKIDAMQTARQAAYDSAPKTVVSKSVKPRTIRVLPRGDWMDDSGEIVQPAIPEFLGELQTDETRLSRLDLANWLSRRDNPLTARTMVNRLWSLMFGRGICASVDDFGGQGTYPSYPALLDELALEFIDSGWDIKNMMRTIAMSETYQRSSTPSAELLSSDPYNDLFARQGRFCVEAESVRDLALAASGLLVEKVGGPSVRPYQPAGYYASLNFPRRKYQSDQGDSQYRRGLYTHWQRTFLHPMLKAFDAPSREECTAKRARSNTPLQALVLLNDPTFVEAARVFAQRIVTEGGQSPEQRIAWAYRAVISRTPNGEINEQLKKIFESHLAEYQADPDSAKLVVEQGNSPAPKELDRPTLAAWTSVARVILNLHESITRY